MKIDDVRIKKIMQMTPPGELRETLPVPDEVRELVHDTRQNIHRILYGADDRLVVVIGPCSIHDPEAAMEYATKLQVEAKKYNKELLVVMRVYFEKPRTTVGWKGLMNDPYLDDSFKMNDGIHVARKLLIDINTLGMPAGTEFLDLITPQYIAELVAWGAIGARTTESQTHRELASGLSCPVGFKNATSGDIKVAIDAIGAARAPHHFVSVGKDGQSAIVATIGNEDCHMILRGGKKPNYDAESVSACCHDLAAAGIPAKVMIDFSHANSEKKYKNQLAVCDNVYEQVARGDTRIFGVMVESHLVEGRQDLVPGQPLVYGQSITDSCIGFDDTIEVLEKLAKAVRGRRIVLAKGED